ncbi:MAG: hypothetical protein ACO3A2_07840 [Bdellovibrionia bacterium]
MTGLPMKLRLDVCAGDDVAEDVVPAADLFLATECQENLSFSMSSRLLNSTVIVLVFMMNHLSHVAKKDPDRLVSKHAVKPSGLAGGYKASEL